MAVAKQSSWSRYHESWLPGALAVRIEEGSSAAEGSGGGGGLSVSAQLATDRSQLRVLVVNNRSAAVETALTIAHWRAAAGAHASVTVLSAPSLDAANSPSEPERVSPQRWAVAWPGDGAVHSFPPLSVSVLLLNATVG